MSPADELRLYDSGFTKDTYIDHVVAGGKPLADLGRVNARIGEYRQTIHE